MVRTKHSFCEAWAGVKSDSFKKSDSAAIPCITLPAEHLAKLGETGSAIKQYQKRGLWFAFRVVVFLSACQAWGGDGGEGNAEILQGKNYKLFDCSGRVS